MNQFIENYITKNYYELLSISKKITKNNDLSQDLLHEVILQLYNKENIILREYDDKQIKYYIVSILRTNWYSNTSPFYYKVRREIQKYTDINEILTMSDEQEQFEKQMIFDILEEEWCELDWFRKALFEMYMTLGSMKKVAHKTTIPLSSISNYLKESRTQIKKNVLYKLNK
jgi:hydroxymethylpyrimidine pyrophosphatase-like HAD family hydrolase